MQRKALLGLGPALVLLAGAAYTVLARPADGAYLWPDRGELIVWKIRRQRHQHMNWGVKR